MDLQYIQDFRAKLKEKQQDQLAAKEAFEKNSKNVTYSRNLSP